MGAHIKDWLSFKLKILTWILELRARVKVLEQLHQQDHIAGVNKTDD